jgi:hypothetical protein
MYYGFVWCLKVYEKMVSSDVVLIAFFKDLAQCKKLVCRSFACLEPSSNVQQADTSIVGANEVISFLYTGHHKPVVQISGSVSLVQASRITSSLSTN